MNRFCFWYYDGEQWTTDDNVVEADNLIEARKKLLEIVNEDIRGKYPLRVVFANN